MEASIISADGGCSLPMSTGLGVEVITDDGFQMLAQRKTHCTRKNAAVFLFGVTNIGVRVCQSKKAHYWMTGVNFEGGN